MNNIGVVILNYKNFSDTINCIKSVLKYSANTSFTLFVVDNFSQNYSLEYIYNFFIDNHDVSIQYYKKSEPVNCNIVLIQNFSNRGYAFGNNVGLKLAYSLGFKYLLVLNNDVIFIENPFPTLLSVLNSNPSFLCVGPLLLKGDKNSIDYNCAKRRPTYFDVFRNSYFGRWLKTNSWEKKYYYLKGNTSLNSFLKVDIISGSFMLFNGENLNSIDFFDESTFLYYEEAILAEKAKKKGLFMVFDPRVTSVHLGAQSTSKQSFSWFLINCEYESLIYYLRKYRSLSKFMVKIVTFSNYLFLKLYKFKHKI